jgi:hypothetical protein
MLPFGEQSWHTRIPLRDHAIPLDNNFRAIRLQRQGLPPVGVDEELSRHPILDLGPRVGRGSDPARILCVLDADSTEEVQPRFTCK